MAKGDKCPKCGFKEREPSSDAKRELKKPSKCDCKRLPWLGDKDAN